MLTMSTYLVLSLDAVRTVSTKNLSYLFKTIHQAKAGHFEWLSARMLAALAPHPRLCTYHGLLVITFIPNLQQ